MRSARISIGCLLVLLVVNGLGVLVLAQESRPSLPPARSSVELRRHVDALCSDEQGGRSGAPVEETRRYLGAEFEKLGLAPISGDSYALPFATSGLKGVNLAGVIRSGAEKKLPGYVIISAHYDHLGRRGDRIFRGACDNASGVAAMLEIVRGIDRETITRDIVIVAFDLEERGLLGSAAWCERPPLPLVDCQLFITMDMLGRQGLGIVDDLLFAQGWEWTPELLTDLERAVGDSAIDLSYFWTDIAGDRSDFVAFKHRQVPHLFFSTGENEDYHQATDLPERIDFDLLRRQAELVGRVAIAAANRPERLVFLKEPLKHLIEFVSLRKLADALMTVDHPRVTAGLRGKALILFGFAAKVVGRGEVTDEDRAVLRRVAAQLQDEMR